MAETLNTGCGKFILLLICFLKKVWSYNHTVTVQPDEMPESKTVAFMNHYYRFTNIYLSLFNNVQIACCKSQSTITMWFINLLPCGTIANFFLTAVGPIQHTKEGNIGRERRFWWLHWGWRGPLPWADGVATSYHPLFPTYRGQCVQSHMMT